MHIEVPQGPNPPNGDVCLAGISPDVPSCDFIAAAEDFGGAGVPVFPVSTIEKAPLVANPSRFGLAASYEIAERHPTANVGFWCGEPSGLTVVDIDSPALEHLHWARETFGPTDVQVRTSSGKYHLYYRHNGEPRATPALRDRPIDLLGSGLCIAPPSIFDGRRYEFFEGGHEDLRKLPTIRPDALSHLDKLPKQRMAVRPPGSAAAREGERNNSLFTFALKAARNIDDHAAYIAAVLNENARYTPPLSENEAMRAATMPWEYKMRGSLFSLTGQTIQLRVSAVGALFHAGEADALFLHAYLAGKHFTKGKVFAIAGKAMAKARLFGSWGPQRIYAAAEMLVTFGILERVHQGGRRKGDPSRYRFVEGAIH